MPSPVNLRGLAATVLAAGALLAAAPTTASAGHEQAPGQQKQAGHHHRDDHRKPAYSFAVIGDIPYGDAQIKAFPTWIQQINASRPGITFHVGDIKNGSTRCDDPYYAMIKSDFDMFTGPFVYTPGDNEWTDCHRANNGSYNPLDRLALVRKTFFAKPGVTLGQRPVKVASQVRLGVPENVSLERDDVAFATLHVVGSNDDLLVWNGIGKTEVTAAQAADQARRMTAAIENVHDTYEQARRNHDRAVVLMLQADMFDPTYPADMNNDSAFTPLIQAIIDESNAFRGESYLINGDSHVYNSDQPLKAGSPWLGFYGVKGSSPTRRITTDGSSNNKDYLQFTVNRSHRGPVLSWTRVPYTLQVQG